MVTEIDSLVLPLNHYALHLEILKLNQVENLYFATTAGIFKYSFPVGVNESMTNDRENLGLIYPNPFHSKATIRLYNSENENKFLRIYNLQGEIVRTEIQFTADQIVIERKGLTSGLYFYNIRSVEGKCFSGKFIID